MPILIRLGVFFIWVLAAVSVERLLLLNVLASAQWNPSAGSILNTSSISPSPAVKGAQACTRLRDELGSEVVHLCGEGVYVEAIQNPNSLYNSFYRPACVVAPQEAVHVQKAMATIYEERAHYAVMSGGHTAMTGWNTVQDGVLIYFTNMNNVTYDAKTNRATIQPGVRWGDALQQLEPYGVAPMGGRLGNIGTGLLLGGGISYLAPENGWSTDAITEMDVVLVNGQQVTATANNQYSDLFRALKGGGNRFGIVTRFEVEPIRVGRSTDKNWYGGVILVSQSIILHERGLQSVLIASTPLSNKSSLISLQYPESSVEALIRATHTFIETNTDPRAAVLVILGYVMRNGRPIASHTVAYFYRGSNLPREVFGDFLDIPSDFQHLAPVSYQEAASIFGSGDYRESGERFSGTSFAGGPEKCLKAYKDFRRFALESTYLVNSTVLALTPIPRHQIQVARNRGGNALDPSLQPYISAHWHTVLLKGQEQIPPKVELGLQWLMRQNPPSAGAPLDMNESDATQNVYATYGNYEFLRRVYRKYDPTRFNVRYSQGPIGL
ncbi:FAD-binding domain-containing protein [Macrolepiota fuliginosa MF-IS2]|uniref:FAD-binding domain-containing protein n=1 Tax=Macrolepiota fuliginosa MF-IS2 TaxID=1400762 RepID=A0A9P5WZJ2_9AGAR|nr:FAD-binding domain-containing protein [Macrolepiota fuliginosa MF-IS2]